MENHEEELFDDHLEENDLEDNRPEILHGKNDDDDDIDRPYDPWEEGDERFDNDRDNMLL